MSIKALIALAEKSRQHRDGELSPEETAAINARLEESYKRAIEWDLEVAERIKQKEVTPELLAKVCSI